MPYAERSFLAAERHSRSISLDMPALTSISGTLVVSHAKDSAERGTSHWKAGRDRRRNHSDGQEWVLSNLVLTERDRRV